METQGINLYIVDENKLRVADLKLFLENKFGVSLNIMAFYDGESCLQHIDKDTHIVILDYGIENQNGIEILKTMKVLNPKVEVIMMAANENVGDAVKAFREGAKDYVMKGQGALAKIGNLVSYIVTEPLRLMVREFGISKFVAAFLLTFIGVGGVVFVVMKFMN